MEASVADDFDYEQLDPGIRRVVRLLREASFDTTDSGDGVTKLAAGWDREEVHDQPHVHCQVQRPNDIIRAALLMERVLTEAGVDLGRETVGIQAMYSPLDGIASVVLYGVSDADLPA